jgi:hypothetical protein
MRPIAPAKRNSTGLILIAGLVIGLLIAAYLFRDTSRAPFRRRRDLLVAQSLTDNPAADLEISNFAAKITRDRRPVTMSST